MAGVGFSLRSLRSDEGYGGLLRLYGAAGVISSGPWLISILTLLLIGVLGRGLTPDPATLQRFQVAVTWLFALSLLAVGPLQLAFTRFIADRNYLDKAEDTLPNLLGCLAFTSSASGLLACALSPLLHGEPLLLKLLFGAGFVTMCNTWIAVVVLTGLRAHRQVLRCFALGYLVTFGGCLLLARYGEVGLLAGFVLGQAALLFCSVQAIASQLPAHEAVAFSFLDRRLIHRDLLRIGLLHNLAIWADKLLFWLNPATSYRVLGELRASEVYDLPIFLAYLTIVPGMAVFLVRVETDFAERHAAFYGAIRSGAPLSRIERLCEEMTDAARRGIADIVKVQVLTLLLCFLCGPSLLRVFGLSQLHLPLFYIDTVGAALQVLLLAITSLLFYLDRRREVERLTLVLLVANLSLSWASQQLGASYYGFGFALAGGVASVLGVVSLTRVFATLVRDTFMLQPVGR